MPPTPASLLILATVLPLVSFVLLIFIGRRMGNPLSGYVATAFIGGSFVCGLIGMIAWFQFGQHAGVSWGPGDKPIDMTIKWLPMAGGVDQANPGYLDVGIYLDSLTIVMFCMVTLVGLLVHVFSLGYMEEDSDFPRYFTYLGFFCFAMLGLLLAATLLQLFAFWELIGICAYLLIGFWHKKKTSQMAAIRSFVIGRIGDCGFLIGLGILVCYMGNVSILTLCKWLGSAGMLNGNHPAAILLPNGLTLSGNMLTIIGVSLFLGAMGKSAQFPLHVWLADSMEAPTPVSALIQAATTVAAGVYLVARIFPILTPDARLCIAIIGVITLTMGALIAVAQTDIKRILAYSTISQLGFIMLAMGIGSWIGAMFLLITHAFFSGLLILGCGSVIRAAHHEQDITQFGGLMKKIPVTAITFAIGVLAIAGTPLFSGYFSMEMILSHAGAFATLAAKTGHSRWYQAFFILPAIVGYITAFYMTRCWMLTFWGKPRNQELHDKAREAPLIWFPLVVLAVFTVVGGSQLLNIRHMLVESMLETQHYCDETAMPGARLFTGFDQTWPIDLNSRSALTDSDETKNTAQENLQFLEDTGEALAHKYAMWAFIVGIFAGCLVYLRGFAVTDKLMKFWPLRIIRAWLLAGMYFEDLYQSVFAATAIGASGLAAAVDRRVIDGTANFAPNLALSCTARLGRKRIWVMMILSIFAIGLSAIVTFIVCK